MDITTMHTRVIIQTTEILDIMAITNTTKTMEATIIIQTITKISTMVDIIKVIMGEVTLVDYMGGMEGTGNNMAMDTEEVEEVEELVEELAEVDLEVALEEVVATVMDTEMGSGVVFLSHH